MQSLNVVILSGACCNPILRGTDEALEARIRKVAGEFEAALAIKVVSIATVALGGLGLGPDLGNQVRALIATEGMGVLPILIVNGQVVLWGGLPTEVRVRDELVRRLA